MCALEDPMQNSTTQVTSKSSKRPKTPPRKVKTRASKNAKKNTSHEIFEAPVAPTLTQSLDAFLKWLVTPTAAMPQEVHTYYTKDLFFKDPLTELYTSDDLESYYGRIFEKLSEMRFVIENRAEAGNQAFISWVMMATTLGQDVSVRGVSHLKFDPASGLCEYHRDYFDLAGEVYEQIPVLGLLFKGLKKALN
jgi:steroid delta-isomerase